MKSGCRRVNIPLRKRKISVDLFIMSNRNVAREEKVALHVSNYRRFLSLRFFSFTHNSNRADSRSSRKIIIITGNIYSSFDGAASALLSAGLC